MAYTAIRKLRFARGAKRKGQVNTPVIYLGSVQILCPVGEGICGSAEEILQNCGIKLKHNLLPKRTLEVKDGAFELSNTDSDPAQESSRVVYKFRKIICCGVDGKRPKILLFNYHHGSEESRGVYLTHAFMCETRKAARKLALVVSQHFKSVKLVGEPDGLENTSDKSQPRKRPVDSQRRQEVGSDHIALENM